MIKTLTVLLSVLTFFCACFGPFRQKQEPEPVSESLVIESPTVSINWDKIRRIHSDKEKVETLLGPPDFIDRHKVGEDWYYSHTRSNGYAVVSFPISGHLVNHVQYVKRPKWK